LRVALFATCLGEKLFPEPPRAIVTVLERPEEEGECG
jgi:hypothetical protein